MILSRRNILRGISLSIAAPAIVRIESIMRVAHVPQEADWIDLPIPVWRQFNSGIYYVNRSTLTVRDVPILDWFATVDGALKVDTGLK